MGGSVYSIKKLSSSTRRERKSSSGTPRNQTGAVIRQNLTCRICGQQVLGHLFTGHTELCAVKIQWEVRSLECDNYLRKLNIEFRKHLADKKKPSHLKQNHIQALQELQQISQSASTLLFTQKELMDDMLDTIQIYQDDEQYSFIKNAVQELYEWLSYKKQVWNHISNSRMLIRTLVGDNLDTDDNTITGLSIHIPSLKDFEILKLLTKGGFARVYLAKKDSDIFAIKVLSRQDLNEKTQMENVFAERNIMATTSCPFVVRMFYAFATKVFFFFSLCLYFVLCRNL